MYKIRDNFYQHMIQGVGCVFYSYSSPVLLQYHDGRLYRSNEFHSITTSRHIDNYLTSNNLYAEVLDKYTFDNLIREVIK